MKSPFLWIGVVSAVLLLAYAGLSMASTGNDQAQISQALDESIESGREGRPGGVLDRISQNLTFNDQEQSGNMRQIAQFVKNQKPDVTVVNRRAIVTGDEAVITSPVDLSINILGQTRQVHLKDVLMVFRKENRRQWLVVPVKKWVLAEVKVPKFSAEDLTP